MRLIKLFYGNAGISLTTITLYQINRRTDKGHTAHYAYITGHQVVKVEPVYGGTKEFLKHQYNHRTRITDKIERNNEEAYIPFYFETSNETLEKKCLETKIDSVDLHAIQKNKINARQLQSGIIESHKAQRSRTAGNQPQQET